MEHTANSFGRSARRAAAGILSLLTVLSASSAPFEAAALASPLTAAAAQVQEAPKLQAVAQAEDGFTFLTDGETASLTKYEGDAEEVVIPETFRGAAVAAISSRAFENSRTVVSVDIPASVKTIEEFAFAKCSSLQTVTLREGLQELGYYAFQNCPLTSVHIPASLEKAQMSFIGCDKLKTVTFGEGIKKIPSSLFEGTTGLTAVTIPETVTAIGEAAFQNCTNLAEIDIPANVNVLENYAFSRCSSLEKITLNEGLKELRWLCFYQCPVKKIYIPASLEKADKCFSNCASLSSVTFGEGITKIPSNLFQECSGLTGITIPETVTEIGDSAFRNCGNLAEIDIPANAETVGGDAFTSCSSLEKVTLHDGLKKIGWHAFYKTPVTDIYIPVSLEEADNSFAECSGLKKVTFGEGITKIPARLFKSCSGLTSVTIPETVTEIGESAFDSCTNLTEADIPESVQVLRSYAFSGCTSMTKVTLREGLKSLEWHAFSNVPAEGIRIPASLESADSPFAGCGNLKQIVFGEGITAIPGKLFQNCSGVTDIVLPDTVEKVGDYAFSGCESLLTVSIPDGLKELGWHAFFCSKLSEIYIPASLEFVDAPFSGCANLAKVTFGEGIQTIPATLFKECPGLQQMDLPDTVEVIGDNAFLNCSSLQKVTLPEGLKQIKWHAFCNTPIREIKIPASLTFSDSPFAGCVKLTKASFGEGITELTDNLFRDCRGLTAVTIPETVTVIGSNAFNGCSVLKDVTLPAGLEKLKWHVFTGSAIESITLPPTLTFTDSPFAGTEFLKTAFISEGMTALPESAFSNAQMLEAVTLPDSMESLGPKAFYACTALNRIEPLDKEVYFPRNTFIGCDSLMDQRFSLLDRANSSITANTSLGAVNGIVNFTVKYSFTEENWEKISNPGLALTLPENLVLLPETVTSDNQTLTFDNPQNPHVSVREREDTIRFSARIEAAGTYRVTAAAEYTYNHEATRTTIGNADIEAPDLTFSAPEITNALTVRAHGIAGRNEEVTVYVNGEAAASVKASSYTGKYSLDVPLPDAPEGTVFQLYAKSETAGSEPLSVTYRKNQPQLQDISMSFNNHAESSLNITDVFTDGKTPVVSFNPAYPFRFSAKLSNTSANHRLFITSEKGDELKYLEAQYDAKTDTWNAEGFFSPTNKGYVPGALNISVLKPTEAILFRGEAPDEYAADDALPNPPQALLEKSTAPILEQTDHSLLAQLNIANGTEQKEAYLYTEEADGIFIEGTYTAAADIAKDPAAYGFEFFGAIGTDNPDLSRSYTYYQCAVKEEDVLFSAGETAADVFGKSAGIYSGTAFLKKMNGNSGSKIIIKAVKAYSEKAADFRTVSCGAYGSFTDYLGTACERFDFTSRYYPSLYSERLEGTAVLLFASQLFHDLTDPADVTAECGFKPPAAMLIKCLINALLRDHGYLDDIIAGNKLFPYGGFIRFIVDPSGTVYEAVPGNPVEGAELKIYYLDPDTGEEVLWNAEDYDQENPLISDETGAYAWDVPEGKWKVVCSKEGYDTAESEWMDVPPVRTGIQLSLVNHDAPKLVSAEAADNGVIVKFSKFIDIKTAKKNIELDSPEGYDIEPLRLNEGDAYADAFLLKSVLPAGEYTVNVKAGLKSYAGTAAKSGSKSVTVEADMTAAPVTGTTTASTTTTTTTTVTTTTQGTTAGGTTSAPAQSTTSGGTTGTAAQGTTTTAATTAAAATTTAATTTTTAATTTTTAETTTTATAAPVRGDLNGDGAVRMADAVLQARLLSEEHLSDLTAEMLDRADVNKDGKLTLSDLAALLQLIAKD